MIEQATVEVPDPTLEPDPIEIPLVLHLSLAIPVFAVLVFIFMRLFNRRVDPPAP